MWAIPKIRGKEKIKTKTNKKTKKLILSELPTFDHSRPESMWTLSSDNWISQHSASILHGKYCRHKRVDRSKQRYAHCGSMGYITTIQYSQAFANRSMITYFFMGSTSKLLIKMFSIPKNCIASMYIVKHRKILFKKLQRNTVQPHQQEVLLVLQLTAHKHCGFFHASRHWDAQ